MKTKIKVELFGYGNFRKQSKYLGWNKEQSSVARITGYDWGNAEFSKIYLHGYVDYSNSNSVGSRGIYKYYFVDNGLYEIHTQVSWKKFSHYFLLVENENQTTMNFEEAIIWIKEHSESMF